MRYAAVLAVWQYVRADCCRIETSFSIRQLGKKKKKKAIAPPDTTFLSLIVSDIRGSQRLYGGHINCNCILLTT